MKAGNLVGFGNQRYFGTGHVKPTLAGQELALGSTQQPKTPSLINSAFRTEFLNGTSGEKRAELEIVRAQRKSRQDIIDALNLSENVAVPEDEHRKLQERFRLASLKATREVITRLEREGKLTPSESANVKAVYLPLEQFTPAERIAIQEIELAQRRAYQALVDELNSTQVQGNSPVVARMRTDAESAAWKERLRVAYFKITQRVIERLEGQKKLSPSESENIRARFLVPISRKKPAIQDIIEQPITEGVALSSDVVDVPKNPSVLPPAAPSTDAVDAPQSASFPPPASHSVGGIKQTHILAGVGVLVVVGGVYFWYRQAQKAKELVA